MTAILDQPSTRQDIDNLYKKIKGEFATKDDLKAFATKDDLKQLKEEIIEFKDEVVGELKAIQENQEVHNFSHARINDDLDDHETRIGKLEKTLAAV